MFTVKAHWTNISLLMAALLAGGGYLYFIAASIDTVTHGGDAAGRGMAMGYTYILGVGAMGLLALLHLGIHVWFYRLLNVWGQAVFWLVLTSPLQMWVLLNLIFRRRLF